MNKLLFLNYSNHDACSFYRSAGIAKDLREKGFDIDVVQIGAKTFYWSDLLMYDVVMIQRPYTAELIPFIKQAKIMGIKLWLDYDDNLLEVPEDNPAYTRYMQTNCKESVIALLKLADVVSVTTLALKVAYQKHNQNIVVIPNAFNDSLFMRDAQKDLPKRKPIVAWRGSDTHQKDIMTYPAVNNSVNEFPEWKFMFIGYNAWFLPKKENRLFAPATDIMFYHYSLYSAAPSVMQVPLHDSPFNRAKSSIAAIEGAFAGAAVLCPYWWNIEGAVSYKDEQSYEDGLYGLLRGHINREEVAEKTWEFIMDTLRLSKVNELRVDLINNLVDK